MIRATLGAVSVIAVLALALPTTLDAYAASAGGSSSSPGGGASSSPGGGSSSVPGGGGNNPGGNDDTDQPQTPEEKLAQIEETCNGALSTLAKVPEKMVISFDNETGVNVVPICNTGVGKQAKIDAAQALPLQTAIANNPALIAALKAKGFTADDVVGVVLLNGAATLYVHKHA